MIELYDKYFKITTPGRSISITWWPLSSRVILNIDDGFQLSFRTSREIYDRVVNPLVNGEDEEIAEVLIDIARRFKDSRTHEKYVEILAHFGVREVRRWLRRSPKRHFFRRVAGVKADCAAGVRREWGSVFVAEIFNRCFDVFVIVLDEEPKLFRIRQWVMTSEGAEIVLAIKIAEEGWLKYADYLEEVSYHGLVRGILASVPRELWPYLYIDALAVHLMVQSMS